MQKAEQLLDDLSPEPQGLTYGKQRVGPGRDGGRRGGGFRKENMVDEIWEKVESTGKGE